MKKAIIFNCAHQFGKVNIYEKNVAPYLLASRLRANGYRAIVVDKFFELPQSMSTDLIKRINPDYVLFSVCMPDANSGEIRKDLQNNEIVRAETASAIPSVPNSMFGAIADAGKEVGAKIVVGGSFWLAPNQLKGIEQHVDYLWMGYGDSIVEFLNAPSRFPFYSVYNNTRIVDGNIKLLSSEFNHGIIYNTDDFRMHGENLPLEIGRGCVHDCDFCTDPLKGKKKTEWWKSDFSEIVRNAEENGTYSYFFVDENYNDSIDKLDHFRRNFDAFGKPVSIHTFIRLDALMKSKTHQSLLLNHSGHLRLMTGIETFNKEDQKKLGKIYDPDAVLDFLRWSKEVYPHVQYVSSFIVGLPSETEESLDVMYRFFEQARNEQLLDITVRPLGVFNLYDEPNTIDWYSSKFTKDPNAAGYHFEKKGHEWKNPKAFLDSYNKAVLYTKQMHAVTRRTPRENRARSFSTYNTSTQRLNGIPFVDWYQQLLDTNDQTYPAFSDSMEMQKNYMAMLKDMEKHYGDLH